MTSPYGTPGESGGGGAPDYTGAGAPGYAGLESAFTPGAFGAGAGGTVAVADNPVYIDSAIIRSRFRMRYDAGYDLNSPDKAEFFYAKCGCYANPVNFAGMTAHGSTHTVAGPGTFNLAEARSLGYDPKARGPQHGVLLHSGQYLYKLSTNFKGERRIDFQDFSSYFEYAPTRNFSTFVEVPVRFLNPSMVANYYGFSDINAGFKYAFVAEANRFYTFQLRGYVPTGAPDRGLGTGHPTLEPALLIFQRLTDRVYFSGELRDWIPINGSNFAGNIIRYGTGLTYNMVLTEHFRVAPVNEVVGWSILGGKETTAPAPGMPMGGIANVGGQAIVNELIGLRFGLGNYYAPGGGSALNDRHSLAVSYGRCITGDHWYKDVFLAEYNFWF
jgi:hypothetical protein